MVLFTLSCAAKVLEKTETTATIVGKGESRAEAKIVAGKKARELFVSYKLIKPDECSQDIGQDRRATVTNWTCTIFVEAQK